MGVGCNDTTTMSTCGLGLALWREKPLENTDQKWASQNTANTIKKLIYVPPPCKCCCCCCSFGGGGGGGGGGEDTILPSLKILPRFANLQRVRELQGLGRGGHSLDVWYHVLVG